VEFTKLLTIILKTVRQGALIKQGKLKKPFHFINKASLIKSQTQAVVIRFLNTYPSINTHQQESIRTHIRSSNFLFVSRLIEKRGVDIEGSTNTANKLMRFVTK
jgi:hypothetical protein